MVVDHGWVLLPQDVWVSSHSFVGLVFLLAFSKRVGGRVTPAVKLKIICFSYRGHGFEITTLFSFIYDKVVLHFIATFTLNSLVGGNLLHFTATEFSQNLLMKNFTGPL
jgi:hypothetical protein